MTQSSPPTDYYRYLAIAIALLWIILALCLLISPDIIYWIFDISGHPSADLLARRAGMLFVGLASISYLGRNAPPSDLRQSVTLGMGITMFGLFCTSLFEWLRGGVGPGAWVAIIGEAVFVVFAGWVWFQGRD